MISVGKKFKSDPISTAGNPYALLNDGAVTKVVYMQNYSLKKIEKTLGNHKYDDYVICSEFGKKIYVGERFVDGVFVAVKPFNSWIIDLETGLWVAPKEYSKDGYEYYWKKESVFWEIFEACLNNSSLDKTKNMESV